jgi:hypothetical protein
MIAESSFVGGLLLEMMIGEVQGVEGEVLLYLMLIDSLPC